MSNFYNKTAVIYMRLSKDDRNDESLSISNQRDIIAAYCLENNIRIVKEFVDDGWKGGNFDRPGFKDMITYLKSASVDLVITKDLSRLGRDMTESSMYAERFFPEHGIRYLAISDNFDSFEDNLLAPFQFAMNDVYIRDASRKIKAVLKQKRKNGQYCSCPPFGYKKAPRDKYLLVPDEETAPIVRYIFECAAKGRGAHDIADELTSSNMITPLKYRVLYRDDFSEVGASRATDTWCYTTVRRIIQNQVYLGNSVFGKTQKVSPKSSVKRAIPESDWIVIEHTHEPLIDNETFELANQTLRVRKERHLEQQAKHTKRINIFRGIAVCENCGTSLVSGGTVYRDEWKSYWYLSCRRIPKRDPKHCDHGARIPYYNLVRLITDELNSFIDLNDEQISNVIKELKNNSDVSEHNAMITARCDAVKKEIANSDKIITKLYLDNINGIISDERLSSMVSAIEEKTSAHRKTLQELEAQFVSDDRTSDYEKFFDIVKRYTHIEELTEDIVRAFIDRIEIGEQSAKHKHKEPVTQNIKIFYKFIGPKELINVN